MRSDDDSRGPVKDGEKTRRETSGHEGEKYILRLYVSGATPRSTRAITNLRRICETHLQGRYELEVIDLYQRPELAKDEQIVAAPTLVKRMPVPLRKFIGDLSDTEKILVGLELIPTDQEISEDEGPKDGK